MKPKQPLDYEEECSLGKAYLAIVIILLLMFLALSEAFAGGGEYNPPTPMMPDDTCQLITGYDYKGWQVVEYSDMMQRAKEHGAGKIKMERRPSLICRVPLEAKTICHQTGATPKGPITECNTVSGNSDGEIIMYQWWWKK